MAFLTEATPPHEFGSFKDPRPSKSTMLPLSITLTLQAKACETWPLGITLGLRCRPHRVVRYGLLLSILLDCLSFHLQGPRIVVLSLTPLTVSNRHLAYRSCTRVNCDFLVPTPPVICFNRFTVDRHVADCDCVQVHLVRTHSPSLESSLEATSVGFVRSTFSLTGNVILWSFSWGVLVHTQLLAYRTHRKVY